jgi:hypothetical protein
MKQDCFFRALPQKHSWLREKSVPGAKCPKKDLQCYYCVNMVGEMEKPLVIGKAAKPRWFKNLKINNLSVFWKKTIKKLQ